MEALWRDLRFSLRSLARARAFTATVILTLALGIGGTTAIFSALHGVVLAPLPYPDSEDLIHVRTEMTDGRLTSGMLSPLAITRINEQSSTVERIAGAYLFDLAVQDLESRPLKTAGYVVTEGWFDVFGKSMALGRSFLPEEHGTNPLAVCCVVLSHRLWRSAYNADPSIVGKSVPPGLQVVGVTDAAFDYPVGADLWIPFRFGPNDGGFILDAVGRVTPGATQEQAQVELRTLATRFAEESSSFRARTMVVTDLKQAIIGATGTTLLVLLGAAGTLLLIACANVMNLLLARGVTRSREVALRSALGAGRLTLARQLLVESLVLAGAGAALGLAGAEILLGLATAVGPEDLPRLSEIGIDAMSFVFAAATTFAVAVAFAFLSSLRFYSPQPTTLLSGCARNGGAGGAVGPLFSVLVFVQTALATTLVIGAGLLVRSYEHLRTVERGFVADSVLVMDANLPQLVHPDFGDVGRMYEELVDRVRDVPGVAAAGAGSTVPLGAPLDFMFSTVVVGHPAIDEPERARIRSVTSGYFESLGVTVLQGRGIGPEDRMGELPVAVVNQTFVTRFLEGEPALGQRVRFATATNRTHPVYYRPNPEYEIVGVVGDARYEALADPPEPTAYLAHHQAPTRRVMVTAKVSGGDPGSVSRDMREAFAKIDGTLPVEFVSMDDLVHASLATDRIAALVLLAFGMSALSLAAVGIYGVIGLSVAQRIPEMAIRTAVGAAAGAVYLLCAVRGVLVAGAGIAAGIGGALLLQRLFETQLFEVTATDALVLVGAPGLLALVALVAISVPAARATRLDLAKTLRSQ